MIVLKEVTIKNFLSVGNLTQTISLNNNGVTLILGENCDLGGGEFKNGTGKTTLVQAICFGLYGQPLTNIKKDNLINSINLKNMVVTIDYENQGKKYRIERGRKPTFLKYYVDDGLVNLPETSESHGENKWTQNEIDLSIGLSFNLFKHIVVLHTKSVPFLNLNEKSQREIIEELLGITQLSIKSEVLKEQIKQIKDEIKDQEIQIKTLLGANDRIQKQIIDIKYKSQLWDKEHDIKLIKLNSDIKNMEEIDIDKELLAHTTHTVWSLLSNDISQLESKLAHVERSLLKTDNNISDIITQLESVEIKSCPICSSKLHDSQHITLMNDLQDSKSVLYHEKNQLEDDIYSIVEILESKILEFTSIGDEPVRIYNSLTKAFNHKNSLDKLYYTLEKERDSINPYIDQIANLSDSGLQDINYDYLNELIRLREHQEFLYKILTSKESFIRKKIIDQNICFLNSKLKNYLEKIQLPHTVTFQNDLSVIITNLGKDYDFDQLSNGESNRLILSLAWSFRDIWENINDAMNLMIIDELVDSGLDMAGTDSSLDIIKSMTIDKNKNIFLISHKDGLESRVDSVLIAQKENGFTTYLKDD